MVQLAEVTANTRCSARGYLLPAASAPGNPGENRLLAQTMTELGCLGRQPGEVALDGGFVTGPTERALAALVSARTFIRACRAGLPAHPQAPGPLPHRV